MNVYQDAYSTAQSLKLIYAIEMALLLERLLREPIEFSREYDAERYVLTNPYGHAKLMHKRIVVSEFFGSEYRK
jgi:hypothetical protein